MSSKARGLADLGNAFDDGALSNRNLIINGGMVIDQRNGGASVTGSASAAKFAADRFSFFANTTGTITIQQVSDAPDGFANSNKVTCTSAATSDSSASRVQLYHAIEGHNTANLAFGSSSAKAITLSFWVKASNTGTYGGSFVNGAANRSYPYQYTISASNTWEYKIITISGDTTGTWATDNTTGMYVFWSLGIGSTFEGTANQWNGAFDIGPPSSFSLKDNLNATLQITGVQLEVGDTATPFENRSYGDELARCQRYFQAFNADSGSNTILSNGIAETTSQVRGAVPLLVQMRAVPSVSVSNITDFRFYTTGQHNFTGGAINGLSKKAMGIFASTSASMTAGHAGQVLWANATGYLHADAEL
ncbi:hypothetical protein UM181_15015 [Alphaproteobacteria bacterium US3C007]|nr:hypothetical protein UM181_15015 [Alphaproteobacteria bacterium US3C007]